MRRLKEAAIAIHKDMELERLHQSSRCWKSSII